jgi:hypothetical protein
MCIRQLCGIAQNGESEAARVSACAILLDRGWGKAEQLHTGEGGGDIRITIRQIVESSTTQPKVIDEKPNPDINRQYARAIGDDRY